MKPCNREAVKFWGSLIVVLIVAAGWSSSRLQAQRADLPPEVLHYADTVLYNGKILTADDQFRVVEAAAIRDKTFLAVGRTDQILPLAGPKTRKIDLKGRAVTPGIIDVHQHPFGYGMMTFFKQKNNVQWEGVLPEMNELERDIGLAWSDVDMFLRDVKRGVDAAKPGEPLVLPNQAGRGIGEGGIGGRSICQELTLERLDAASPNTPVVVLQPVNLGPKAINSKMAEFLKLPAGTPAFLLDGTYPCPTVAAEKATSDYIHWRIPLEEKMPAFRYAQLRAHRYGITMVKEHNALPLLAGIRELWARGEMTLRTRMPIPLHPETGQMVNLPAEKAERFFMSIGNISGIGDDMWRFVNVRPGGVGGNMMSGPWTLEPKQRGRPGLPDNPYGVPGGRDLMGESFTGRGAMVQAIRYGWDVSFDHTIGDRAVAEVLKAIEEGLKNPVVKRPNQIITINHTPDARPEQIQKMMELGIRPSVGPWHVFMDYMLDAGLYQYGIERVGRFLPFKTFIRAGVKVALEGDTFYTPPFWRMEKAITRKDDKYQRVYNPSEKVTREEALRMSTLWAAYNLNEDKKLGSIETGKLADLIVIDKDYLTIPEDDISEIKVLLTIVDGKVVYEVPGVI